MCNTLEIYINKLNERLLNYITGRQSWQTEEQGWRLGACPDWAQLTLNCWSVNYDSVGLPPWPNWSSATFKAYLSVTAKEQKTTRGPAQLIFLAFQLKLWVICKSTNSKVNGSNNNVLHIFLNPIKRQNLDIGHLWKKYRIILKWTRYCKQNNLVIIPEQTFRC